MRVESFRSYSVSQEASFESMVSQMGRLNRTDSQDHNKQLKSNLDAERAARQARIDQKNAALETQYKEMSKNQEVAHERQQQAAATAGLLAGLGTFALSPFLGLAGIGQLAASGLAGFGSFFSKEIGGVFSSLRSILGDAGSAIGDVADGAKKAAGDAVDAIGDAASSAADAVGDAASSVGDAISDLF